MALTLIVLALLGAATGALSDCTSSPAVGLCDALIPRYFFNVTSGQCQFFHYGGCGGNNNNYKTLDECERTCGELTLEDCSAEAEVGMCRAAFPMVYFDVKTGQCKDFIYGGCGGNRNNFLSEEECHSKCGQFAPKELTLEECSAEPETGMCRGYFPSFFFNPKTGVCESFVYGGCGGNSNNFGDHAECEGKCGKFRSCLHKELSIAQCSAAPEVGPCKASVPSFYFDISTGKCEKFIYGGCGGNDNRFNDIESCNIGCGRYVAIDVLAIDPPHFADCTLEPQVGLCKASMPRVFFNTRTGKCQKFIYGGCGGNSNNFHSIDECNANCQDIPLKETDCNLAPVAGICLAYIPSFFYNVTSGQCESFVYGGCGGNSNRFATRTSCHATCVQTVEARRATVGVCAQPQIVGPCRAAIPRFYFDTQKGSCQSFLYGGCQGNDNNFQTVEECHNTCQA